MPAAYFYIINLFIQVVCILHHCMHLVQRRILLFSLTKLYLNDLSELFQRHAN